MSLYNNYFEESLSEFKVFNKIRFNGHLYTTSESVNKYDNSCICTSDGVVGTVKFFFIKDEIIFLIAEKLVKLYNPFFCPNNRDLKSHLSIYHRSNELFIVNLNEIEKVTLINLSPLECFVSTFRIAHLFS